MTDHAEKTRRLETKPVGSLLWELSLPAVAAAVIGASHHIVNRIFVGQTLGEEGVAAVTLAFPFIAVMLASGMMISIGSSTLISIRLGEKKYDEAERLVGQALLLFIFMSIGFFCFGMFCQDAMLRLFRTSENVMPLAKQYISIIACGAILHELTFGVNGFLRAEGKARTAMFTNLLAAVLNIFFDYLFLVVFRTGIWGAATATLLAQFFSTIWIIWHYTSGKTLLRWRLKYIRWNSPLAKAVFILGLPPFIMQMLNFILQSIQMYQLGYYGELYGKAHGIEAGGVLAINVIGIIFVIGMCLFFPLLGLNQGMQPIIGYNIGAKRYDRVATALKLTICTSLIFTSLCTIAVLLVPELILTPFVKADSPNRQELIMLGSHALRAFALVLPGAGLVVATAGYFQANGMAHRAIMLTLTRQVFILIPALLLLPPLLESTRSFNGMDGIWYAVPISDFGAMLVAVFFIFRELRRLKRLHRECQTDEQQAVNHLTSSPK